MLRHMRHCAALALLAALAPGALADVPLQFYGVATLPTGQVNDSASPNYGVMLYPMTGDTSLIQALTYAKETLDDTDTQRGCAPSSCYNIGRDHFVVGDMTHRYTAGSSIGLAVTYELEDMVFAGAPLATVYRRETAVPWNYEVTGALNIQSGGDGASYVTFHASSDIAPNDTLTADNVTTGLGRPFTTPQNRTLVVLQAKFAHDGEGDGTITRTVNHVGSGSIRPDVQTVNIKVAKALIEEATKPDPNPMAKGPTVPGGTDGYLVFDNGTRYASVGSLQISVETKPPHLNARWTTTGADQLPAGPADEVAVLADIVGAPGTDTNFITYSGGNFTFPSTMWLDTSPSCDAVPDRDEIRSKDADGAWEAKSKDLKFASFDTAQHLCIEVDGKTTKIPATEAYTAAATFRGLRDAAFPPNDKTYTLGKIERAASSGMVSFHLPFLTTAQKFNQRIAIVNRGEATSYAFTNFQTETGTTPTEAAAAMGTLPQGRTVVRTSDMVTFTGKTRGAATLEVKTANPANITVSVQTINLDDGSLDTEDIDRAP